MSVVLTTLGHLPSLFSDNFPDCFPGMGQSFIAMVSVKWPRKICVRMENSTTGREQCYPINTLRPRQNGRHFPDDIFKGIFLNENEWISLKISLKVVPWVRINNIPALVQIMAWRRPGDKPLSGPMMIRLSTHICVTRPQWVNTRIHIHTRELSHDWFKQWLVAYSTPRHHLHLIMLIVDSNLGTKFSEISIEIQRFSLERMPLKMSSLKWRPYCHIIYVLTHLVWWYILLSVK